MRKIREAKGKNSSLIKLDLLNHIYKHALSEADIKVIGDLLRRTVTIGASQRTFMQVIEKYRTKNITTIDDPFSNCDSVNAFTPFKVIPPMLSKPINGIEKLTNSVAKKGNDLQLIVEYKYDGERLQVD